MITNLKILLAWILFSIIWDEPVVYKPSVMKQTYKMKPRIIPMVLFFVLITPVLIFQGFESYTEKLIDAFQLKSFNACKFFLTPFQPRPSLYEAYLQSL